MLKLRDDGAALPAGGVPISPWVDLVCTGETLETNAAADLTVTKASLLRMAGQYLDGADPRNPLASPLYADLSGLPPLLVVVGGAQALLDDSVRLARSAGMVGIDVTLYIRAGMQHLPDLLRRDPRSRRGRGDDRGMDTLPKVLTSTSASQLLAC